MDTPPSQHLKYVCTRDRNCSRSSPSVSVEPWNINYLIKHEIKWEVDEGYARCQSPASQSSEKRAMPMYSRGSPHS